jgi:phage gp45-like
VEASASGATIRISTPGGLVGTPTANVQITAAGEIDITAPTVKVSAAMTSFSGVVQCDLLQATTVAAATYTPGAGNIW